MATPPKRAAAQPPKDTLAIPHPARRNEWAESQLANGPFVSATLTQIALAAGQAGMVLPEHPTPQQLLAHLRVAEHDSVGYRRHLLGYTAANLDAALWVGTEGDEGCARLAAALDYITRANDQL